MRVAPSRFAPLPAGAEDIWPPLGPRAAARSLSRLLPACLPPPTAPGKSLPRSARPMRRGTPSAAKG